MATRDCSSVKLRREVAATQSVQDVMVARPKTLPVGATVADLRQLFENSHVRTALLVDGAAFAGMVDREDVPVRAAAEEPARAYARSDVPSVAPDEPMTRALELLDATGALRLAVLDRDGSTLRGLLCLNGQASGFCR